MSMIVPGETYKACVFGLTAACKLDGNAQAATLYYPRYTKLGARLLSNAGEPRAVLANYIRQEKGWPRGEGVATQISFVGV